MRADQLPLWERTLIASYRWRRNDPIARAPLQKPADRCRVALVTTAGFVPPGDRPFDLARLGGDPSFRVIPAGIRLDTLQLYHRSQAFDRSATLRDHDSALPIETLSGIAADGVIAEVAPRHLSFMGSITAPGRLRKESAPAAAALLVEDRVDIALLAPV